jgi:hypothetical protein
MGVCSRGGWAVKGRWIPPVVNRPGLASGTCSVLLQAPIPALGREEFLTAVTGNSTSKAAADALAAQRLSNDAPDRNDGPART